MNKTSFIPAVLAGATVALVAQAMPAAAASFDLTSSFVTGDNYNIDSQFKIKLEDFGNQVKFTFTNVGNVASSITDVYFGKVGTINNYFATPGTIINSDGVTFAEGATPSQPPGGEFGWMAAYTADSDNPAVRKGVNNNTGEFVSFIFDTVNGNNATSIFNGFSGSNPDLAIAFHVQGIGPSANDSAWYGSNSVTANDVPEPFTLLGTAAALAFGGLFQRERSKRQQEVAANA